MGIAIAVPPRDEQDEMIALLKDKTVELTSTVTRVSQEIALLREYRTRLIADVVTGKLDVRKAAADLPETDPLAGNRARAETIHTESDPHPIDNDTLMEDHHMTNWNECSAVERTPGKVSGAWVFSGTRIPLYALYENLASGATVEQFVEWFPGVEERQVRAVLEHEAQTLANGLGPLKLLFDRDPPTPLLNLAARTP